MAFGGAVLAMLSLLLAGSARAGLDEARINMNSAVSIFVSSRSSAGWWPLRNKKTGSVMNLKLDKVEADSVRLVSGEDYAAVADLKVQGGKTIFAEFTADLSGSWNVKSMRLLDARQLAVLRRQAKVAAAAHDRQAQAAASTRERPRARAPHHAGPFGEMPDVMLATLGGGAASPGDCSAKKCVIVYVAPWCPHCHAATKDIISMRDLLKPKGIDVRVIVGGDTADHVSAFAEEFGPDTMLDAGREVQVPGVPCYTIIEDGGAILDRRPGAPEGSGGQALADALALE